MSADADVSQFELDEGRRSPSVASSSGSTAHGPEAQSPPAPAASSVRSSQSAFTPSQRPTLPRPSSIQTEIHHGTVARATVDTTLAVIPAEAFRRLTHKFPKATAHIVQVIMTRFSRVTFNAAHGYLGLTSEVLRTEKAVNDLACHPLPASFYEGGGMQQLRQRFDGASLAGQSPEPQEDYFGSEVNSSNSTLVSAKRPSLESRSTDRTLHGSPLQMAASTSTLHPSRPTTRNQVQAGDLFSTTPATEAYRPRPTSANFVNTPHVSRGVHPHRSKLVDLPENEEGTDEFDLRQEVMNAIAISIGLQQPAPLSDESPGSLEASPAVSAQDWRQNLMRQSGSSQPLPNSFGSLSLLEMGNDSSSSITGASATSSTSKGITGLDNEVEILFFPAGSHLARAGEKDTGALPRSLLTLLVLITAGTGLFYVIEGFLDIVLPDDIGSSPQTTHDRSKPKPPSASVDDLYSQGEFVDSESDFSSVPGITKRQSTEPHGGTGSTLFTVKPGGIAGYLGTMSFSYLVVDTDEQYSEPLKHSELC